MKTLTKYLNEKLVINKNFKRSSVEDTVKENTKTVKTKSGDVEVFPNLDSFLKCLDDLDIEYKEVENRKYDDIDVMWIEFNDTFIYSTGALNSSIICKYVRIGKPFNNKNNITIRFGSSSKSTWISVQGIIRNEDRVTGIFNSEYNEMINSFKQLVENKR